MNALTCTSQKVVPFHVVYTLLKKLNTLTNHSHKKKKRKKEKEKSTSCKFKILHSPLNHPAPVQVLHFAQYQVTKLDTPLKQLKHLPAKVKNKT
jgi:hypothetical protein